MSSSRVLVIDDELSMRQYLEVLLRRRGYEVVTAAGLVDARARLAEGKVDLVVSDMRLGDESGLQVLREVRERFNGTEVILITAFGTPAAAVEAMREGAYDYICKPFDNEEMTLLVQNALEKRALREENRALRESFGGNLLMVGTSEAMEGVRALVRKVASSKSTVLVTGESGTGKELVARAIHFAGPRAGKPFVPVNCAALAEGVLESELFGHVKGAFTGALSDRTGLLVSAREGTVFLDEIGELVSATQVRLLRVLQERTVKPVGSATEVPYEARVVVATNRKLEHEVSAGRFREDLFYRLNVITIDLPPLRARPGDIPHLAESFLARMREELERPSLRFAPETLRILEAYPFPGNVRQLQNIIERAATLAESDQLGPETLPAALRGEAGPVLEGPAPELAEAFSLERYLDDAERRYLLEALRRADGVKTRAASLLGLTFRSFRYRLAKHGLADTEVA
ncbi:MAG: sigma-54-dependent transcriptional regulator [Myxococcaceae bacterium]